MRDAPDNSLDDSAWNRFWFERRDPLTVCALRIAAGLTALYYHLSFFPDLTRWFGPHGMLPLETTRELVGEVYRFSYLDLAASPAALWTAHLAGLLVLVLFTLGVLSRLTNALAVVVVLSYVHRAPMLIGPFEPILTMVLIYLCLAPTGTYLSLDAWWCRGRRVPAWLTWLQGRALPRPGIPRPGEPVDRRTYATNISLRLLQVHVAMFYLFMGLTKLAGDTWWMGDAAWWIVARTESRLIDFSFLARWELLINAWTHAIVAFELAFAVLIWRPAFRPWLLGLAAVHWLLIALATGMIGFAAVAIVASLAFTPSWLLGRLAGQGGSPPEAGATSPSATRVEKTAAG